MTILSKPCNKCKVDKPLTEYYPRSGVDNPSKPGHYLVECKDCMRTRSKHARPLDPQEPRAATEVYGIEYLNRKGFPTLPGKALHYSWVDAIVFGCIKVEIKYSPLRWAYNGYEFTFHTTPRQKKDGYRADVVMLICDYGDNMTYHFFSPDNPVFFMNGRIKSAVTFTPGKMEASRHANNRVVMTQPMMDEAQDRVQLIEGALTTYCERLKQGA
jgi:hypothetical protein